MHLVQFYGEKSWTLIASKLGNRCDVQCRYRYRQMIRERAAIGFKGARPEGIRAVRSGKLPAFTQPPQPAKIARLPKPRKAMKPSSAVRFLPRFNDAQLAEQEKESAGIDIVDKLDDWIVREERALSEWY